MTCSAPGEHRPHPHETDIHHIVPRSYGGPDTPSNRVELCPNHHHNVHFLLNEYVKAGGKPPTSVLRTYTPYERDLADRGWAGRPSDHPTFTMTLPKEAPMTESSKTVKRVKVVHDPEGSPLLDPDESNEVLGHLSTVVTSVKGIGPKPGYLTTEFWFAVVIALAATLLCALGKINATVWAGVAGANGVGYGVSRGLAKNG